VKLWKQVMISHEGSVVVCVMFSNDQRKTTLFLETKHTKQQKHVTLLHML